MLTDILGPDACGLSSLLRDIEALQGQHNPQGRVDTAHLLETEMTHAFSKSTRIDRRSLFSEHPRCAAIDLDLGPKACGPS